MPPRPSRKVKIAPPPPKTSRPGLLLDAIAPEAIPVPPADFVSTPIQQRRSLLRFIPSGLKAEALLAAEELAARGAAQIQKELGNHVEDTSGLGEAIRQIQENDRALQRARELSGYLSERGQFLESDLLRVLEDVASEVEHLARKNPALLRAYPGLTAFREARGRLVAEGIARAREKKSAPPEEG